VYECKSCEKTFPSRAELTLHRNLEHDKLRYQCDNCSDCFKSRQAFYIHKQLKHAEGLPYQCGICGQNIKFNCLLRDHIKSHSEKGRYSCEHCGKFFKYFIQMMYHSKTYHENRVMNWSTCENCKKEFIDEYELDTHECIKHGKQKLKCEVCGKRDSDLNRHMQRAHSETRPYHCSTCGKGFFSSFATAEHESSVHRLERPYRCDQCPARFGMKSNLAVHRRSHDKDDRPLLCQICGFRTLYRSTFKSHAVIHTGELNYNCEICDMRFPRRNALSRHMKSKGHRNKATGH